MKSDNKSDGSPQGRFGTELVLTGRQRALLRSIAQKSPELSRMYLGGIHLLNEGSNPDALSLAAHAFRELMEKIPEHLDVPVKAQKETARSKIREVEESWEKATANSQCHDNGRWDGRIDGTLRKLLTKVGNYFEWYRKHYPRRRDEVSRTLDRIEVSSRSVPPPLQKLNVATWMELRDFWVSVAHHRRNSSREEFLEWLDALERFLVERLNPRTFDDFEEIDAILREEDNA